MFVYRPMRETREGGAPRGERPRPASWRTRHPSVPVEGGDLPELVRSIVDSAPGRGEGGYAMPSPEEASGFAALAVAMSGGDLEAARRSADCLGYAFALFDDAATGRRLLVAARRRNPGGGGA